MSATEPVIAAKSKARPESTANTLILFSFDFYLLLFLFSLFFFSRNRLRRFFHAVLRVNTSTIASAPVSLTGDDLRLDSLCVTQWLSIEPNNAPLLSTQGSLNLREGGVGRDPCVKCEDFSVPRQLLSCVRVCAAISVQLKPSLEPGFSFFYPFAATHSVCDRAAECCLPATHRNRVWAVGSWVRPCS